MKLQVVGAGLPRTGTESLRQALEYLLDGRCYHMRTIPDHPFNLGDRWKRALAGDTPEWDSLYDGYVAAVDWPTSMFWRELSEANPDALVLLSIRDTAETWVQSLEATILPVARMALADDWREGRDLVTLFEHFTGTNNWDDPAVLQAAYKHHNDEVRKSVAPHRLLEWRVTEGWGPICHVLDLPLPNQPFPWTNRREDWR